MSADKDSNDDLSDNSEFDDDDFNDDDDFDDDDYDDEGHGGSRKRALIVAGLLLLTGVAIYMFARPAPEKMPVESGMSGNIESADTVIPGTADKDSIPATVPPSSTSEEGISPETEDQDTSASVEQQKMNREIADQEAADLLKKSGKPALSGQKTDVSEGAGKPAETLAASPAEQEGSGPGISSFTKNAEEPPPSPPVSRKVVATNKFTIQVGTYVMKGSVNRARRILRKLRMKPEESAGKVYITKYEVLVGDFQDVEEMQNIVKILSNDGISVNVKVSRPGKYTLSALSGFNRGSAYEKKNDLILKGYPAKVKKERKKMSVYILRTGRYSERRKAKEELARLKKRGIDGIILTL